MLKLNVALSKLITSLKEAENLSNDQEIDFLKALLESKELNALVNVHTKVAKVGRDDRLAPVLSTSGQVTLSPNNKRTHTYTSIKTFFKFTKFSCCRYYTKCWSSYRNVATWTRNAKRPFICCKNRIYKWVFTASFYAAQLAC